MPSFLYEVVGLFKVRGKRIPANHAAELGFYAWSCKEWGVPLSQNGISLADMRSIQLDISNSQVSDQEACAVAELVLVHQKWTVVTAGQNAFGDVGAVALISAMRFSRAATVDLSKCGCTGVSCAALAEAIGGSNRMCEPWAAAEDFARNNAGSAALETAAKGKSLRAKDSSDDELGDEEDAKPLANVSLEKAAAMMVVSDDAAETGSNVRQQLEKLCSRWPVLMQGLGTKRAACCLTKLILSHNRLGSQGASLLFSAMGRSQSITHLILFDCDISERASEAMSDMLSRNKRLRHLNLSWNRLRTRGVARMFEGLRENSTLLELLLAWNGCRAVPAFASMAAAIGCASCSLIKLDLANNRINASAAVVLASGVQRNDSLRDLILDANPIGQEGSRAILAAVESATKRNMSVKSFSIANPDSYQPCKASMFNCNVALVSQSSFNPAEPSGIYTLPLEEPYNRVILQNLAMLQFQRKGEFIGIVELNGARFRVPADDSAMEWQPPSSGTIVFKFKSNRKPPSLLTAYSASEFDSMMSMMQQMGEGSSRMQALGMVVRSDKCLLYSQSARVLQALSDRDEKIFFVSSALYKTVADEGTSEESCNLLSQLNELELHELQRRLGACVRTFQPRNPTGFYSLKLSQTADREVAMRLLEHRNLLMEIIKSQPKVRGELQCNREERPEFVMRNVKLDRKPMQITEDWILPQDGVLEFDYADTSKPTNISGPVRGTIIPELQKLSTEDQRLARWKEYLGSCFASLRQVKQGLALSLFTMPENRVEFVRLAFARTLEWHGFSQVTSMLTKEEMPLLVHRLGRHNLFDETAAVGHYVLDLGNDEDRWVAAHIVRLAVLEPGDNMIGEFAHSQLIIAIK